MNLTIIESTQTNNFNDKKIITKMTQLWENATKKLPSNNLITYAVYYNYQSNYKGDYTCSVCIEKTTDDTSTDINITKGHKYKVFTVDTTDDNCVFNTWKRIWEEEEKGLLKRAYTYDYEKYFSPNQIEIYIAIS